MDYIVFKDEYTGKDIKGIPLAKYVNKYGIPVKRGNRIVHKWEEDYYYIVFIPWKHQEKEIREVKQSNIISGLKEKYENWIEVDKYTSEAFDGEYATFPDSMEVKGFYGLPFIYQHKEFVANQVLHNYNENLTILYKEVPELLNEEFSI